MDIISLLIMVALPIVMLWIGVEILMRIFDE